MKHYNFLRAVIAAVVVGLLMLGAANAVQPGDYDLLKYETVVECIYTDVLREPDTLLAVSVKPQGSRFRVLPKVGNVVVCNEWKPLQEIK